MPRKPKSPAPAAPSLIAAPTAPPPPQRAGGGSLASVEEKLDTIILYLRRRDRRERLRAWGGFLRSGVYLAVVVGSAWYLYAYGDELMATLAQQAANAAAQAAQQGSSSLLEQLRQQLPSGMQVR